MTRLSGISQSLKGTIIALWDCFPDSRGKFCICSLQLQNVLQGASNISCCHKNVCCPNILLVPQEVLSCSSQIRIMDHLQRRFLLKFLTKFCHYSFRLTGDGVRFRRTLLTRQKKIENRCRKRSRKLDGIGVRSINQNILLSFFSDSTYDPVTTRLSESHAQAQKPTNLNASSQALRVQCDSKS